MGRKAEEEDEDGTRGGKRRRGGAGQRPKGSRLIINRSSIHNKPSLKYARCPMAVCYPIPSALHVLTLMLDAGGLGVDPSQQPKTGFAGWTQLRATRYDRGYVIAGVSRTSRGLLRILAPPRVVLFQLPKLPQMVGLSLSLARSRAQAFWLVLRTTSAPKQPSSYVLAHDYDAAQAQVVENPAPDQHANHLPPLLLLFLPVRLVIPCLHDVGG